MSTISMFSWRNKKYYQCFPVDKTTLSGAMQFLAYTRHKAEKLKKEIFIK